MKKTILLIVSLTLLLTITGCKKGQTAYKKLECEYDFNVGTSDTSDSTLKISFSQDRKTNELVKGTVVFTANFAGGLSSNEQTEVKKSLNEQFCDEGFFGEGTNKSCKVTTQTKSATVTIEINPEKLVTNIEDLEMNETTLEDLKTTIDESFGNGVKCTVN